eukprot:COSAG04_NODE_16607_length_494_cov_0.569620_1_plen_97_part_10
MTYERPTEPAGSEQELAEFEAEEIAEAAAETTAAEKEKPPQDDTLPPGWERHTSRSTGETYYYNTITVETTYELPTKPAVSDVDAAENARREQAEHF